MNPPLFFSFLSFSQMPLKTAQFVTCLKAMQCPMYKSRNQKTYTKVASFMNDPQT